MPYSAAARKITMNITAPGCVNDYTLWCFPDISGSIIDGGDVMVTSDLSQATETLDRGGKVLFFPEHTQRDYMIHGQYCTDFWNFERVKKACEKASLPIPAGTLGLSIKNTHPALALFPSLTSPTPQWYDIVAASSSLILDETETRPIVSVIDNPFRNHKLGLIFEAKSGKGKLMVCMANLTRLKTSIPAMQLVRSILTYMNSLEFAPREVLTPAKLRLLFTV
jgi:hypothetical protein